MKRASSPSTSIFSIKKKILENVKSVLLSLSFFSLLSPAGVPPVPKLPSIATLVPVFTAFLYLGPETECMSRRPIEKRLTREPEKSLDGPGSG